MKSTPALSVAVCLLIAAFAPAAAAPQFLETFAVEKSDLSSKGKSDFFILEPGFVAVFEGKEKGEKTVLIITVTEQTKVVDGVETRVVEERESSNGKLAEISLNYFAISKTTGNVYYFGEDSATYEDGKISNHEGSWLAGVAGARFGLAMPGKPKVGGAYYQELAPKVAMDRAEIVSTSESVKTLAGEFKNCVKTKESSALEKGVEYKLYAPGVGLVQDAELRLVRYGVASK